MTGTGRAPRRRARRCCSRRWRPSRRRRVPPIRPRCCASRSCRPRPGSIRRRASDLYSNYVNRAIFDPLYTLRLSRAAVPDRAEHRRRAAARFPPTASTWTIRIKPGIYFADDPAFKGKKRELTAADYVYSMEARARSEDALAESAAVRRQVRRRRRAGRQGEGDRQVRLRRAARGPAGDRPLHDRASG